MARGKVGDVVLTRVDGQQVTRVRNSNPKNPRTDKQQYQRAIMATIMRAYSAGQEIFNHAWQGCAVGAECQRRFMSDNVNILRSLLISDTQSNAALPIGRVVAPKATSPVPFEGMRVSYGTYQQQLFIADETVGRFDLSIDVPEEGVYKFSDFLKDQTGAYLRSADIYTFVGFRVSPTLIEAELETTDDVLSKQFLGQFFFVRLIVKNLSDIDPDNDVKRMTVGDLFTIETSMPFVDLANIAEMPLISAHLQINTLGVSSEKTIFTDDIDWNGAVAMIRSRRDMDLRSTSSLIYVTSTVGKAKFGIAHPYILEHWVGSEKTLGSSELILEGGGLGANFQ